MNDFDPGRNPYVGPVPFGEKNADFFFGRDGEINDIASLIVAHRALLIYSPSGAGKSSLLNAKVIPTLKKKGFEVMPPARVRGSFPPGLSPDEIANHYVFHAIVALSKTPADAELGELKRISKLSISDFLKLQNPVLDQDGYQAPRLIVFDQFEEIFTYFTGRQSDRLEFFAQLGRALGVGIEPSNDQAQPELRVILAMRQEYVTLLDSFAELLPENLDTRYHLERLDREAALQAVKEPMEKAGRMFASAAPESPGVPEALGVAEKLVEDLLKVRGETTTGETVEVIGHQVEPVQLQVVCEALWRNLPTDVKLITREHLAKYGDVNQALVRFYEDALSAALEKYKINEAELRDWFDRTLITPARTRGMAFKGAQSAGSTLNNVAEFLQDRHVIRSEERGGSRWYELTHDRLIEPIREANQRWFETRSGIDRLKELAIKADHWRNLGSREVDLLFADQLSEAEQLVTRPDLAGSERDRVKELVTASRIVEDKRRLSRIRTWALTATSVVIVFATLAAFGLWQWKVSKAQGMALNALLQMDNDPELGLLLAMESLKKKETEQGKKALTLGLATSTVRAYLQGHGDKVLSADYSSDGTRIVTGSDDGTAKLWEASTGLLLHTLQGQTKSIKTASFNPEGTKIVTAGTTGTAIVWDAKSQTRLFNLTGHLATSTITTATFSPDGKHILTASRDGSARLWNAGTGEQETTIWAHVGGLNSATFSADGKKILTAGLYDLTVRIWDAERGIQMDCLIYPNPVYRAAFSPDGRKVATASNDGIRIWNLKTNAHSFSDLASASVNPPPPVTPETAPLPSDEKAPPAIPGHKGPVFTVVFSPDGRWFLSGGQDGTARLWDTETQQQKLKFGGHTDTVFAVAFDTKSPNVVTASFDKTSRVWTTTPSGGIPILTGQRGEFRDAAFSPDGTRIITTSVEGGRADFPPQAVILDAKTRQRVAGFPDGPQPVLSAAFHPDGKRAVTTDGTSKVTLSDAVTGRSLALFDAAPSIITHVSCSKDGTRIVAATKEGEAICWDVETKTVLKHLGRAKDTPTTNGTTKKVLNAVISPDGTDILTADSDGIARLYRVADGRPIKTFGEPGAPLYHAIFRFDGQLIVTISADGTVTSWDREAKRIGEMLGHTGLVQSVAFSPKGDYLVTGGDDGRAIISDSRGKMLADLQVASQSLLSVAFNPGGDQLITTSLNGVLELVPWQTESQMELGRNRVHRELTQTERENYSPNFF